MTKEVVEEKVKEGLCKELTPENFISWAIDCRNNLPGGEEIHQSRLIKKLREEVIPIWLFLEKQKSYKIKSIKILNGNENYDGILNLKDGSSFYIEITCAKNGEKELWETRHREEYRGVPITHDRNNHEEIKKAINQGIPMEPRYSPSSFVQKKILQQIDKAIKNKLKKKYSPRTILIVSADLNPFIISGCLNELEILTPCHNTNFSAIYLVNLCRNKNNVYRLFPKEESTGTKT